MSAPPLKSLADYSRFVAELLNRPAVKHSTVVVWSDSPFTGIAEGEVVFTNGLRLRMREEVDFAAGLIVSYGYEVYRADERLYWYDDFPHPHDKIACRHVPAPQTHPARHPTSSRSRAEYELHTTESSRYFERD